jgi:hypothetical protein
MPLKFCSASVILFAISGCTTTLKHEKLVPGEQPTEPGFTYYLPRQRFAVTATYEIRNCPDQETSEPLVISQTASIVESPVADVNELYSVPIKTLTAGWKTTEVSGTLYDNQTIHTFGAMADDKTAEVAKGAIGTVLSVARTSASTFRASVDKPRPCKEDVYKALKIVRKGQEQLLDSSVNAADREFWASMIAAARASLQISETYFFNPTLAELKKEERPQRDKVHAWFTDPPTQMPDGLLTVICVEGVPNQVVGVPTNLKGQGIIYREPVPVVVRVATMVDGQPRVLATLETQAAQFGRYSVIPLVNEAFQKNNLKLSFAANGRLESFTYGLESSLEKAATFASETAGSIETYAAARKAARVTAAEAAAGAELKALVAETELLNARAAKIEAEKKLANLLSGN